MTARSPALRISKARIAKAHGADLVNYTEPGCRCGWGCSEGKCPAGKRHWFATDNLGEPHDSAVAREVLAAIAKGTP